MNDGEIGAAIRQLIVDQLAHTALIRKTERATELHTRVEGGYRIVTHDYFDDGRWMITDAETSELLADGVGHDAFDASWQENWWHADAIGDEVFESVPDLPNDSGLPDELFSALRDWIENHPSEARQLIDQPPPIEG